MILNWDLKTRKYFLAVILTVVVWSSNGLEIRGKIEIANDWKPIVFLASLNSPENLFLASPEFVIAEEFIQPDGNFIISTTDVPADLRFYRLYMVRSGLSSVEFNTNKNKNYIHLLLDRESVIEIDASIQENTLQVHRMDGSADNNAIAYFDKEFANRRVQFTTDLTRAKKEFLTNGLQDFIRNFTDTVSNSLVGLYALYHLDDKETDFLRNSDFYFDFQKRLDEQYTGTFYAQEYADLLRDLVGFRDMVCEIPGVAPKWKDGVIIAESVVILILLLVLIRVLVQNRTKSAVQSEKQLAMAAYENLTAKEKEIFKLLAQGKSNKEIAADLFVELSTVKTHINSIYKQLNLSSRKDAIHFYNSIPR